MADTDDDLTSYQAALHELEGLNHLKLDLISQQRELEEAKSEYEYLSAIFNAKAEALALSEESSARDIQEHKLFSDHALVLLDQLGAKNITFDLSQTSLADICQVDWSYEKAENEDASTERRSGIFAVSLLRDVSSTHTSTGLSVQSLDADTLWKRARSKPDDDPELFAENLAEGFKKEDAIGFFNLATLLCLSEYDETADPEQARQFEAAVGFTEKQSSVLQKFRTEGTRTVITRAPSIEDDFEPAWTDKGRSIYEVRFMSNGNEIYALAG